MAGLVSDGATSWSRAGIPLLCHHVAGGTRELPGVSFIKTPTSLTRVPSHDLITPKAPPPSAIVLVPRGSLGGTPPAGSTPAASPLTCTNPDVKVSLCSLIPCDLLSTTAKGATTNAVVWNPTHWLSPRVHGSGVQAQLIG